MWWGQGEHAGKRGNPSYNIGMACGQVSGEIIAIDLDCHSDEANGLHFLRDWEVEHGKLPETWTQITGSGGKQLFYRARQDIRNSANGEIAALTFAATAGTSCCPRPSTLAAIATSGR